jgi:phosphoglucosamine mutase
MNKKIFGTDGIRSLSNDEIFNNLSLNTLSKAILKNNKNLKIVIGRDTRESSKEIESNFINALKNNGAKIFKVGLLSTPAISYLIKKLNCNLGIVVSASHNPYQFNGIKFFNKNGEKLSDSDERKIEKYFFKLTKKKNNDKNNGKIQIINNPFSIYKKKFTKILIKNNFSSKLKIVIDCANGSSYKVVKYIFSKININLIYIKDKPNGRNINYKCGSLYPQSLIKEVKKKSADLGISFDGDGDRLICCDEKGKIIDGDKILACLAQYIFNKSRSGVNSMVGTLMSNRGLEKFVNNIGLKFYRSNVGDKFVYELMKKKDCFLGGEQSGHIILKKFGPSGDGILIALYLIKIISEYNKKTSEIFDLYNSYFQIQKNIKLKDSKYQKNKKINNLLRFYNNKIIDNVRVLIRLSGTEPVIRLLVEGKKYSKIRLLAKKLDKKIKSII